MVIKFNNYSLLNKKLKKEILAEINLVLNLEDNIDYENYSNQFEDKIKKYFDVKFCISLDSGTTALQLALTGCGIKQGDEVVLPCYTYAATALAISNIGAKPVFVDINENDLTINPNLIKSKLTNKTKAIIPVHIHGNPCEIDTILDICKDHKIKLIEDCSQAHGAEYKGKKVGSFGVGCFSLHSSKTLGGIGDSGIITLNDKKIYDKIRKLMVPDNNSKEILLSKRTPCIMDCMQAAIIKIKLRYLDNFNNRKNAIANLYNKLLNKKIKRLNLINDSYAVYRDYCIRTNERDKLQEYLLAKGIETKARYKIPLHLTKTFSYLDYKKGDFPITEKISEDVLCLPSFIGITDEQIECMCKEINNFMN